MSPAAPAGGRPGARRRRRPRLARWSWRGGDGGVGIALGGDGRVHVDATAVIAVGPSGAVRSARNAGGDVSSPADELEQREGAVTPRRDEEVCRRVAATKRSMPLRSTLRSSAPWRRRMRAKRSALGTRIAKCSFGCSEPSGTSSASSPGPSRRMFSGVPSGAREVAAPPRDGRRGRSRPRPGPRPRRRGTCSRCTRGAAAPAAGWSGTRSARDRRTARRRAGEVLDQVREVQHGAGVEVVPAARGRLARGGPPAR